jgi:hypothetical protein
MDCFYCGEKVVVLDGKNVWNGEKQKIVACTSCAAVWDYEIYTTILENRIKEEE